MCGEQPIHFSHTQPSPGSPPRVRGTVAGLPFVAVFNGITPACAGNSACRPGSWGHMEDHPRVCGEQGAGDLVQGLPVGSPPRVRGTGKWQKCLGLKNRITPACAGNSLLFRRIRNGIRDHPRVCGEQVLQHRWRRFYLGSPPRVRGTANTTRAGTTPARITPACAGNRHGLVRHGIRFRDHPRVCGEQRLVKIRLCSG